MQNIITLEILNATSENGFSLDELVYKTKELFTTVGMAGFASLILRMVDEKICMDIVKNKTEHKQPCCRNPQHDYHDRPSRQFRTSIGKLEINWRRLQCRNCGKSITPLRDFLGLERHQSKSLELEKLVTEVVSEQSYRRSSSHLFSIGNIPVPRSTAHQWVVQSDSDQLDETDETFDTLFVDGTGYKRRPNEEADINNRGELRIVLGVNKSGSTVPLGAFSGESWEQIATAIKGKRPDEKPIADMLVCDGENAIAANFANECNHHQRCHWHCTHDLNHTMWQDGAKLTERKQKQSKLAAIIGIELPEEDYDKVDKSDKVELAQTVTTAERKVSKMISDLYAKGYVVAADYLSYASKNMFSYVHRWLLTGIVGPRASSMIERMMRELARRLKRMAFGWSEEGAAQMARIIIKRFTSADQWEKYWKKKLRIQGNVILILKSIKVKNPQTLGR